MLKQHFVDNFRDDIPCVYTNLPHAPIGEKELWMRFSVRAGESFHHAGSAANGILAQQGRVWLQVFTPSGQGEGDAIALLEEFASLFRNRRLAHAAGTVHLATQDIDTNPVETDGYLMTTVSIPWESFSRYPA